jgi:hypothetical protein
MLNSIFLACCSGCSLSCFYFPLFSLNVSGISDYLIWGVGVHNTTCSSYRKGEEEWEKKKKKKNESRWFSNSILPDGNLFERKKEWARTRNEEMSEWMRKDLSFFFFIDVLPSFSHDSASVTFMLIHNVKRSTTVM